MRAALTLWGVVFQLLIGIKQCLFHCITALFIYYYQENRGNGHTCPGFCGGDTSEHLASPNTNGDSVHMA
jgi:hypothetical protein